MRARNIKPGFFKNDQIGKLTDTEKVFFIGLWCMADKEGYFEIRPGILAAEIFPYNRKITEKDIAKMLSNLISWDLIVSNGIYGLIPKFSEHQRPHPDEARSRVTDEIKAHLKTLINQSNGISLNLIKSHEKVCESPSDIMNDVSLNKDIMNDVYPATGKPPVTGKPVAEIHFSGTHIKIPKPNHQKFADAYPCIDLESEYRKMDAWLMSNPRSQKRDKIRFANNWLARCKPERSGGNGEFGDVHLTQTQRAVLEHRKRRLANGEQDDNRNTPLEIGGGISGE